MQKQIGEMFMFFHVAETVLISLIVEFSKKIKTDIWNTSC